MQVPLEVAAALKPSASPTPIEPPSRPVPSKAKPAARERGADALLAAADQQRLAGNLRKAATTLSRLIDHHSSDPRAALAALTLGRISIELGQPEQALRSLARAEQLGLPPALEDERTAWLVLAYAKAGRKLQARAAAERYHARFPTGPRREAVDAWARTE